MFDYDQKTEKKYMTRKKFDWLETWVTAFLRDVKTRGLSAFTHEYYRAQLKIFVTYATVQGVTDVLNITPDLLRGFMLDLEANGRNEGGRHAAYRAVRAFLNFYIAETEPADWKNPIAKVKPPKPTSDPIHGVPLLDVKAMLETCGDNFTGVRDKAILYCLLDSGARMREFLALNLEDVDFVSGAVDIRKGKGKKIRVVFVGKKSRRALRAYIRIRKDESPALWVTRNGGRLAVSSFQGMLTRRCELAGVAVASAHDFRRSFAVTMLRAGCDVFTLQKLMGHTSLEVLKRYLALLTEDTQAAHEKASPVDGIF